MIGFLEKFSLFSFEVIVYPPIYGIFESPKATFYTFVNTKAVEDSLANGSITQAQYNQIKAAVEICKEFPRYYAWCTTFDLNGIRDPGWSDEVIEKLKRDFDHGALAVKVWKEIGMQLKDSGGNFIQVDDSMFDSIFNFIQAEKKKQNPAVIKFKDPTAAQAILAAMDRDLALAQNRLPVRRQVSITLP